MPLVLVLLVCAWLLIVAIAVILCAAARRTDDEISASELAPVIELRTPARQHVA